MSAAGRDVTHFVGVMLKGVHVSADGIRRTGSWEWVHTCRQDMRAGRNGSSGDPFAATAATGAMAWWSGMLIA